MMRPKRSSPNWRHWILCLAISVAGAGTVRSGLAQTSSGSWSTVAPMPTARDELAAATGLDGRIYALGGVDRNPDFLNTVEAYTPSTNTWSTVAPMQTSRWSPAAATGSDGRIYAIGGNTNNGGILNTVEAYDPSTNTWSTVASMPTARAFLAGASGSDGRVYAMGGSSTPDAPLSTVEVYTPAISPAATPTVPMPGATSTAMATSAATPTSAPARLTAHIKLGRRSVQPGQQQSITVSTAPSAQVTITLTFPNRHKMPHRGTAGRSGTLVWRFKEPGGTVRGRDHTVKVAVKVQGASGQTVSATARYTTR